MTKMSLIQRTRDPLVFIDCIRDKNFFELDRHPRHMWELYAGPTWPEARGAVGEPLHQLIELGRYDREFDNATRAVEAAAAQSGRTEEVERIGRLAERAAEDRAMESEHAERLIAGFAGMDFGLYAKLIAFHGLPKMKGHIRYSANMVDAWIKGYQPVGQIGRRFIVIGLAPERHKTELEELLKV